MGPENPGGRKFTQFVPNHVFRDIDIGERLSVVHDEGKADEIRCDHGATTPGLDRLLVAPGNGGVDLGQELLLNEGSFL